LARETKYSSPVTDESLSVTGEGLPDGLGFELLAASLRSSSADLKTFVEVLGEKLELALPQRVKVARRAGRVLSRNRRVSRIEVSLGDERYLLAVEGGTIETRWAKVVRGVVLKTESLPLDAWIDGLARGLAAEAQTSERSRLALEQLLQD
jgi:hypothetical protein